MTLRSCIGAWTAFAAVATLCAQTVSVTARVASQEVYIGQSFLLEVDVEGSNTPEAPDLSVLEDDFRIQDAGGGSRSSQSISIVNGQFNRVVQRGYTFRYQLAPVREGVLTIPSLTVAADGREFRTQEIPIRVNPPTEVAGFQLRATLSETSAYVGQPLLLTTTWYVGRNADQVSFGMPLLDDDRFDSIDFPVDLTTQTDNLIEIAVNGRRVVARRQAARLEGQEYLAVSFVKVLIPKEPGRYELPSSTASFRAAQNVRQAPSPFGGLLGGSLFNRTVYENIAIPSNRPVLEVSALPVAGRPANFSGLVGSFTLAATASPTEVNVGDPISLELTLGGPSYLDYARLPDLSESPGFQEGFTVPNERPRGVMRGSEKAFSQSIRARTESVTEIPPVVLHYFDPQQRSYAVARTNPIPISVGATRMLTSADLELGPEFDPPSDEPTQLDGIYTGSDVLQSTRSRFLSFGWLIAFTLPPLAFFALVGMDRLRVRSDEPDRNPEAERALAQLRPADATAPRDIARILREYLGAKLGVSAAALTFADCAAPLRQAGAPPETLESLSSVFRMCDEAEFAGRDDDEQRATGLCQKALAACEQIERLEALP